MFPPLPAWISMNLIYLPLSHSSTINMLTISISCWIFIFPSPNKTYSVLFIALTWCLCDLPFWYMWVAIDSSIFIYLNNCFLLIMHSTCMVNTSIFGIPSRSKSRQQLSWLLELPSTHHVFFPLLPNVPYILWTLHSFHPHNSTLPNFTYGFPQWTTGSSCSSHHNAFK